MNSVESEFRRIYLSVNLECMLYNDRVYLSISLECMLYNDRLYLSVYLECIMTVYI